MEANGISVVPGQPYLRNWECSMQDILEFQFGDSCYKAINERKTSGAHHIFGMIVYMEHMGFATFWLDGHSKGLWKRNAHGAGKTVKYGSGPIFVLFLGFFFVWHENYCKHLQTQLQRGWQHWLFFFKTLMRTFLRLEEDMTM